MIAERRSRGMKWVKRIAEFLSAKRGGRRFCRYNEVAVGWLTRIRGERKICCDTGTVEESG